MKPTSRVNVVLVAFMVAVLLFGADRSANAASKTYPDKARSVNYIVPWSESSILRPQSVDLAISHSVLEHVNELDLTYAALSRCLKPGAYMSHQIDLSGHGMSTRWNGYRTCPE